MSERERERLSIGREYELVFSVCTHTCGNKEVDIEGVCVCVLGTLQSIQTKYCTQTLLTAT